MRHAIHIYGRRIVVFIAPCLVLIAGCSSGNTRANPPEANTQTQAQRQPQQSPNLEQRRQTAEKQVRPDVERERQNAKAQADQSLDKDAVAAIAQTQTAIDAISEKLIGVRPSRLSRRLPGKSTFCWLATRRQR